MRQIAMISLVLGAALGAAVVIGLWWASPVPTFILFTSVLHGLLLGLLLRRAFDQTHIASSRRRAVISVAAALISVIALFAFQYTRDASIYRGGYVRALRSMQIEPSANESRFALYDRNLLLPLTGRGGIAGYLALRYPPGTWRRYAFGAEALIVIALSVALPVVTARPVAVQ
jgi:hypothetical protein